MLEFLAENSKAYGVAIDPKIIKAHQAEVAAATAAGKDPPPKPGVLNDGNVFVCTATVILPPLTALTASSSFRRI